MILSGVEVGYCPTCLGLWFEKNELDWAKEERDRNLRWLDVELWKEKEKFRIFNGLRLCPGCRLPLYEVYYGDSGIVVDVCNVCEGIWLDRGEFKKIINWLKQKADYKILNNYLKVLLEETAEILVGPKAIREEVEDFLTVLKLLRYKFVAQYPAVAEMISSLPR